MPRRPHPRTHRPSNSTITASTVGVVHPGDSLCGYRVVRKLGDATRAEVYLGFSESTMDSAHPTTAALKIFRASTAAPSITTELEALDRGAHPHVVRFTDVATTPDGLPCLVLERLNRGSLAHLLEQRPQLDPGEIVTILAPIATALDALHASGVTHNGIGARSVLFRESGAPVLARFGRATLFAAGQSDAALSLDPSVLRDREDFGELVRLLLSRTGRTFDLPAPETDGFGEALATSLFALAEAAPVRFATVDRPGSAVPARVGGRAALGAPSELAGGLLEVARAIVARVVGAARTVRTPVWVAAASVVVALVAAIALVPGEEAESSTTSSPPTSMPPAEPATDVDDPVAAAATLLAARERCIASISVLCLDGVDQQGSQAFDTDAELISGIQAGGEVPDAAAIDYSAIVLVERLGDTALLGLGRDSKPASVLVIKGEAGWRIRDYLDNQ